MLYTKILYEVRGLFDLSNNEYCVADIVRVLSSNADSPVPNRCTASRDKLAGYVLTTRQSVITILKELVRKGLVAESLDKKEIWTTELFNAAVSYCSNPLPDGVKILYTTDPTAVKNLYTCNGADCKESLHPLGVRCKDSLQQGVKILYSECKDSLQQGVKFLYTIYIYNNNTNTETDTIPENAAFPDSGESVSLDAVEVETVEDNGENEKPPKVALKGSKAEKGEKVLSVVTQIKLAVESAVPSYYWQAKDAIAAKRLAAKISNALVVKNKDTNPDFVITDEQIVRTFTKLVELSLKLPVYYHFKDLPTFETRYNETVTQLRTNKPASSKRSSKQAGESTPNAGTVANALSAELFGY